MVHRLQLQNCWQLHVLSLGMMFCIASSNLVQLTAVKLEGVVSSQPVVLCRLRLSKEEGAMELAASRHYSGCVSRLLRPMRQAVRGRERAWQMPMTSGQGAAALSCQRTTWMVVVAMKQPGDRVVTCATSVVLKVR